MKGIVSFIFISSVYHSSYILSVYFFSKTWGSDGFSSKRHSRNWKFVRPTRLDICASWRELRVAYHQTFQRLEHAQAPLLWFYWFVVISHLKGLSDDLNHNCRKKSPSTLSSCRTRPAWISSMDTMRLWLRTVWWELWLKWCHERTCFLWSSARRKFCKICLVTVY